MALGAWGKQVAERRYRRDGYRVLARNWRCSSGELDLIVGRGDLVVFSEVKTRSSTSFGWPAEAVDRLRQERLQSTGTRPTEVHFDVVSVLPGLSRDWREHSEPLLRPGGPEPLLREGG